MSLTLQSTTRGKAEIETKNEAWSVTEYKVSISQPG